MFNAGARRLGAEAAWQELLSQQSHDADANPASRLPLDDSVFSANEVLGSFAGKRSAGGCIDTSKLLQRDESPVAGSWWHLIWQQACTEVRKLLANEDCLGAARVKEEMRVLEQSSSAAGQELQVRLQKYTKTMRKSSQFKIAEDEKQANELCRERREREPKRLKVEP